MPRRTVSLTRSSIDPTTKSMAAFVPGPTIELRSLAPSMSRTSSGDVSEIASVSRDRSSDAFLPAMPALNTETVCAEYRALTSVCSLNGYDWARPASSARNETGGDVVPAVMLSPKVRMRETRRLGGGDGGVGDGWGSGGGGVVPPGPMGEPPQPSVSPAVSRAAPAPMRNCLRNIPDLTEYHSRSGELDHRSALPSEAGRGRFESHTLR